jgi:hypothetical protein
MHATRPITKHLIKQANIQGKKSKINLSSSAVSFTDSGDETPLLRK